MHTEKNVDICLVTGDLLDRFSDSTKTSQKYMPSLSCCGWRNEGFSLLRWFIHYIFRLVRTQLFGFLIYIVHGALFRWDFLDTTTFLCPATYIALIDDRDCALQLQWWISLWSLTFYFPFFLRTTLSIPSQRSCDADPAFCRWTIYFIFDLAVSSGHIYRLFNRKTIYNQQT